MINLLSESAYVAQTNKIKTAITNKVNAIKASLARIGAKLGEEINWLDDVESTLDDELTAINTELTDKGSTQADDFSEVAEKISDIETGITPSGQIAITQNGTYDVTNYASASVDVPSDDSDLVGILSGTITKLTNSNVTSAVRESLHFSNVEEINFPSLDRMEGTKTFADLTKLKKFFSPNLTYINESQIFYNDSVLEVVDLGKPSAIWSNSFANCSNFVSLVLRKTTVTSLGNANAFTGTPFRNGTGGTVYVPQALVSSYQNATNWSALESTTFSAIQENLVALNALGVDITGYYEIVTELPTSGIATDIVYFIETQTAGIFEQWFYGTGSWVQLADITLGGS